LFYEVNINDAIYENPDEVKIVYNNFCVDNTIYVETTNKFYQENLNKKFDVNPVEV
jgi:hypothetical protein